MKRLNLMLAMMLMFTVAAWCQGGSGGGAAGGQGGAASGGTGNGGANNASGTTTGSAGGSMAGANGAAAIGNSLEGCLVQQGTDYFIQPTKGNNKGAMIRLIPQSGQDFSAQVGHKVKVHGAAQMAANGASTAPGAPVEGKKTNITNQDMASAKQGTNVPNSVTTPDQNPPAANDALAGSGSLPQGSEVRTSGMDFGVTSIDSVSDTCNAKASKHKNGYPASAEPPL